MPMSTPLAAPRWEPTARWERRYREVLDAAATIFADKGYAGASTRDIAERLGVRQASLYYYFPSKEAALAAICELGVRDFIANLHAIINNADDASGGKAPGGDCQPLARCGARTRKRITSASFSATGTNCPTDCGRRLPPWRAPTRA